MLLRLEGFQKLFMELLVAVCNIFTDATKAFYQLIPLFFLNPLQAGNLQKFCENPGYDFIQITNSNPIQRRMTIQILKVYFVKI